MDLIGIAAVATKMMVENFGGKLTSDKKSVLSESRYLSFEGLPVAMPKSKRREFFKRFPKCNGSANGLTFTVRLSAHNAVSCREAAMFDIRVNEPMQPQIDELRTVLEFIKG